MARHVQVPAVLFRGYGGHDIAATRVTLPTFTDVKDIAAIYAEDKPAGRVQVARLLIQNPFPLGNLEEDVVEIGHLQPFLVGPGKISQAEFDEWVDRRSFWRLAGEEIDILSPPEFDADGRPFSRSQTYTDTYRVADDGEFLVLAKKAGFDGYAYRGTFTSGDRFVRPVSEIERDSSFDDSTASSLEFRPFTESQIVDIPWPRSFLLPGTVDQELDIARESLSPSLVPAF